MGSNPTLSAGGCPAGVEPSSPHGARGLRRSAAGCAPGRAPGLRSTGVADQVTASDPRSTTPALGNSSRFRYQCDRMTSVMLHSGDDPAVTMVLMKRTRRALSLLALPIVAAIAITSCAGAPGVPTRSPERSPTRASSRLRPVRVRWELQRRELLGHLPRRLPVQPDHLEQRRPALLPVPRPGRPCPGRCALGPGPHGPGPVGDRRSRPVAPLRSTTSDPHRAPRSPHRAADDRRPGVAVVGTDRLQSVPSLRS